MEEPARPAEGAEHAALHAGDAHLKEGGAEAIEESSNILKAKGLPYSTTRDQLLDFFAGFKVLNVEFVREPDGRPSGLVRRRVEVRPCKLPLTSVRARAAPFRLGSHARRMLPNPRRPLPSLRA